MLAHRANPIVKQNWANASCLLGALWMELKLLCVLLLRLEASDIMMSLSVSLMITTIIIICIIRYRLNVALINFDVGFNISALEKL